MRNDPITIALDSQSKGSTKIIEKEYFLKRLEDQIGSSLYNNIIKKYHLEHLKARERAMCVNDVRAILIGISTNTTPQDLEKNPKLYQFFIEHSKTTHKIAQFHRKEIAHHMDKTILEQKNPITAFFLKVGKKITDVAIKSNDLKDAFAGVRINKAFEEDIKTAATFDYARTYKENYMENGQKKGTGARELKKAIPQLDQRRKLASGLYLASDLAYRNLNHGAVIPVLDDDGKEHLYTVHNMVHAKGLVATALIPYEDPFHAKPQRPLDIKILFRGTHSLASASIDLETTGAGSKTMRDNRIKLLDDVNNLVQDLQASHPHQAVSLSVHGHSLGGSFAERFTSELNQAIYFQQTHGSLPKQDENLPKEMQHRMALNIKEMHGKDYEALTKLSAISITSANSARLTDKEARIGEGFMTLTQQRKNAQTQHLNYFKSKGDWVSQAGARSIGGTFANHPKIKVALLSKQTGYGGITAMHPLLGHCDHPLMRYHDKGSRKVSFAYYDNTHHPHELAQKLSSGKLLPKQLQKGYAKMPTAIVEPLTWSKQRIAKISGKEAVNIKGFGVKTEAEKRAAASDKTKHKRRP